MRFWTSLGKFISPLWILDIKIPVPHSLTQPPTLFTLHFTQTYYQHRKRIMSYERIPLDQFQDAFGAISTGETLIFQPAGLSR